MKRLQLASDAPTRPSASPWPTNASGTAHLPFTGDASEVARRLAELDEPGFHNIFVKHVSYSRGAAEMVL